MTNDANEENQGDFLFGGRIVPIKREGNIVYARSLRRGEEDTGEGVALQPGDRLVNPGWRTCHRFTANRYLLQSQRTWRLRACSEYGLDMVPDRD